MSAASATGSAAEVARIADLFSRTDSIVPFAGIPLLPFLNGAKAALGMAMRGTVRPEDRVVLRRTFDAISKLTPENARQFSGAAAPFAYVAWMITGDTALGNLSNRLSFIGNPGVEMRARDALNRGDTASARTIAATFTSGDSIRLSRLGLAGMRTVVRAEVLSALGDTRGAIAQYEALHPSRFATAFVDPGYAVYVRSFAARARLYEEIGERDKAIASWEEFLRRWADGDAITEPARAEARGALQRLRDGARTVGTPS
jgi:tetratricopeptide (TPR) repeat protein